MFSEKRINFSKTNIIKGFFTALFFSSFIYFAYFELSFKVINTIFGLISIYLILTIPRFSLFVAGFFIGIFWFYWISFSFIYYDLKYLIPFIILGFGIIYGVVFFIVGFFKNILYRAIALFSLSFISILGFNWLQIELLFIDSYIGIFKYQLLIVLISFVLAIKFRWYFIFILFLSFDFRYKNVETIKEPNVNIYMSQINISQDKKWDRGYLNVLIENYLNEIEFAINKKYDLIVLPETAFPIALNKDEKLLNTLKSYSQKIDIITGAINKNDENLYNSTYHFSKNGLKIANKVVLVPFGEEIPLPKFLQDFISDTFYGGVRDFAKAKEPTDFVIKGIKFRNAICYETTTHEIFKNLEDTKYVIAISNNAWFTPSIEPTLQKLLMRYYSKLYNVNIYATSNSSENFILKN